MIAQATTAALKESMVQLLIVCIVGVFLFAAGYRAFLGFDPPGFEVTIVTLGGIAGTRAVMTSYGDMQVRRATIQYAAGSNYGPPSSKGGEQ
jgi:hypothetical protein